MLPRVIEQQMLGVHLIIGTNMLINGLPALPNWGLILFLIPTAALIFQALWPRQLPMILRAFFYLWYLVTLLILAFQNDIGGYFEAFNLTIPEIFIFGSLLVFLGLHILVALRFVIITTSLIVPRNRPLLEIIMPRVMHADQMKPLAVMLLLGFAGLVFGANYWWNLVLDQTVVNFLVLAFLQFPRNLFLPIERINN